MWSKILKVLIAFCISMQVAECQLLGGGEPTTQQRHPFSGVNYHIGTVNPAEPQHHPQTHEFPAFHIPQNFGMFSMMGNAISQQLSQHAQNLLTPAARHQAMVSLIGAMESNFALFRAHSKMIKKHFHRQMMVHRTKDNFYNNCGATTRHCQYIMKPVPVPTKKANFMARMAGIHTKEQHPEKPKFEVVPFCTLQKIVCVGNTESCVSKRDCDVAMRITEKTIEGMENGTRIEAISMLNLCHWDEQSVSDASKVSQMLEGVGYATYDKSGNLQCRHVTASDFKLIFLRKNMGKMAEGQTCTRKPASDQFVVMNENESLMNSVNFWPHLCKLQHEGKKEYSQYELQTYLKNHVEISRFSTYFSPPFNFAENFDYQTSSNGMVITGVEKSE